ncbi:MAG: tetratricopeptide repeat protein [Fibrobacterota bacterium]
MNLTSARLCLFLAGLILAPCLTRALELVQVREMFAAGDYRGLIKALEAEIAAGDSRYEYHLYLGNACFLTGKLDKAVLEYKKTLDLNPGAREASTNLASAYSALGRHEDAIALYGDLLRAFGPDGAVYYNLATAHRFAGNSREAETYYRKALELKPNDAEFLNGLGEILQMSGKPADAEKMFNSALKVNPNDGRPRVNLARMYLARSDYTKAESEAKVAAMLDPRLASPHEVLGDIYRSKGEFDMALYEYRASLTRNTENAQVETRMAAVYEELEKYDEAKLHYYNAYKLDPKSMELTLRFAGVLVKSGDYYTARDILNQAREQNLKSVALYDLLGVTHTRLRNFPKAEFYLKEALAIDPEAPKARLHMGVLFYEDGRQTSAQEALEDVLKKNPDEYEGCRTLGLIYMNKRQTEDARGLFQHMIVLEPKKTEGYFLCGRACEQLLSFVEAEKMFQKPLELARDNPDAWFEIADFYFRNRMDDKFMKAVEYYEKTLELDSQYPKRDQIVKNLEVIGAKIKRITQKKDDKEITEEEKRKKEKSPHSAP